MGVKYLLITESPAKSKTIEKMLGSDYAVRASYGHVSDLPKSRLGFDPNDNFKPEYSVTMDKRKVVKELKSLIGPDTIIYLASDDDREGEAIASTLVTALNIEKHDTRRIVFHEITKDAILHAINNPREINTNLANAAMARRILDRAVGYKLSPLLWKKIKFGLSAGRVQSVAVRIIVDRENEIIAFVPEEYWKLKLDILTEPKFKAELSKIDGKVTKVRNSDEANAIKTNCDKHTYVLHDIVEKENKRNPPPPFITSTLQQAASSKLGFGVKQTMTIAQKLYEGSISIPNHTGGIITYMRTDSFNLSKVATDAAKRVIISEYGQDYALDYPRSYTTKSKGAQEAHEAIRPADMSIKPSDISHYLDAKEFALYSLIWSRTMATQMTQAVVANTTYKILGGDNKQYEFVSKGTKILFPGFMKAYGGGNDDAETNDKDDEKILPNIPVGTIFDKTLLTAEQNFTNPPSRYTEATLVKKLETEGIGRPATYASTISTIISRGYVEHTKDKKLAPTVMGPVVNNYLVDNFPNIVDLSFTANIEHELDKIASGEVAWQTVMHNFYDDFAKTVEAKEGGDRVQYSESKVIGKDPETGLDINIKTGQYGTYLSVGDNDKEKGIKAKVSPIPKGIKPEEVTLEDALGYLRVPRILGQTKDGNDIKVNIGKFGPFLQVKDKYYQIKHNSDYDVYTITLPTALELIKTIDEEKAANLWWSSADGTISIINGRYGPYIAVKSVKSKKRMNYKLPKGMSEDEVRKLTLDKVNDIIKNQPVSSGKKFKKSK